MEYPLELNFKILALTPQISVTDASGRLIFYVKMKMFKLKEQVIVFADAEQTRPLFRINADRILDISAQYHFTDANGNSLGSVKRKGMRSLWKAHYNILGGDAPVMTIREEKPWVKVLDGLFSQIPIIGLLSGYILHPAYLVSDPDEMVVIRLEKQPSFFESKFIIRKETELDEGGETRVLLSLMMMILLERARG
ncbi:MAG: hypothetical protein KAS84_07840 [Anaerolineales bacterium]|nr:hypothetical protein [Anaerolineales bacterium]